MSNADLDAKVIALDRAREIAEPKLPEFSDEALALEFAEKHLADLRFVAAWSRWMIFVDGCWKADDTRCAFTLRGRCRRAAADVGDGSAKDVKHASQLASAKTRAAVIVLAGDYRRLAATADQWDADPDLLNTGEILMTVDLERANATRRAPKIT